MTNSSASMVTGVLAYSGALQPVFLPCATESARSYFGSGLQTIVYATAKSDLTIEVIVPSCDRNVEMTRQAIYKMEGFVLSRAIFTKCGVESGEFTTMPLIQAVDTSDKPIGSTTVAPPTEAPPAEAPFNGLHGGMPWYGWLLIGIFLVIIVVLAGCLIILFYRRRKQSAAAEGNHSPAESYGSNVGLVEAQAVSCRRVRAVPPSPLSNADLPVAAVGTRGDGTLSPQLPFASKQICQPSGTPTPRLEFTPNHPRSSAPQPAHEAPY